MSLAQNTNMYIYVCVTCQIKASLFIYKLEGEQQCDINHQFKINYWLKDWLQVKVHCLKSTSTGSISFSSCFVFEGLRRK